MVNAEFVVPMYSGNDGPATFLFGISDSVLQNCMPTGILAGIDVLPFDNGSVSYQGEKHHIFSPNGFSLFVH